MNWLTNSLQVPSLFFPYLSRTIHWKLVVKSMKTEAKLSEIISLLRIIQTELLSLAGNANLILFSLIFVLACEEWDQGIYFPQKCILIFSINMSSAVYNCVIRAYHNTTAFKPCSRIAFDTSVFCAVIKQKCLKSINRQTWDAKQWCVVLCPCKRQIHTPL